MAKKQQNKSSKKVSQDLNKADMRHYRDTQQYVKKVEELYSKAVADLSALALKIDGIPEDKPFSFKANPAIAKEVEDTIQKLADRITSVVETGSRKEWFAACRKSEQFLQSIMKVSKLTPKTLQGYQDRNLEALAQFTQREVNGLNLSARVWKHVAPLQTEVETVVDTTQKYYKHGINSGKTMTKIERAVGTGMSAQELSREVRSCLIEPNKLFRRVRDKYGNLQLSKAAQLYHPGQGVYRSSYKNAMRLTRTEINMAYRQSDCMRWEQLDFVTGFKVELSNNHTVLDPHGKGVLPLHDICDILAGDYPKDFKFVGWHPQCRCHATPILRPYEEMMEERPYIDREGYRQLPASNEVRACPQAFDEYIANNAQRIAGWKSTPYYIKDNVQYVQRALHPEQYAAALELSQEQWKVLSEFRTYSFNHQGSKKFADALDAALKARLAGDLEAFEKAMMEMDRIKSKNDASRVLKAEQRAAKKIDPEAEARQKALDADFATFSPEQQKNIRELEALLKQKKGLRMTYEEANTGRENPNYVPMYIEDPKGNIQIVGVSGKRYIKNPAYSKDMSQEQYRVNCQTCTIVHEMRRRGFNVEAVGNFNDSVFKLYSKQGVSCGRGLFLHPDGTPVRFYFADEWAQKKNYAVVTKPRAKKFLEESMKNDGRYEIGCSWKRGGAHVFCAEKKDGKIVYFDPQNGEIVDIDKEMDMMKLKMLRILRMDNKLINPKIAATFVPKGELPIRTKTEAELRAERIKEAAEKRHKARTKEKEEALRQYAKDHRKKTEEIYKQVYDTINVADGIEEANLDDLVNMMSGKKGSITTKAGVRIKASLERIKKEADALKPVIKEYNEAVTRSNDIMSQLQGISDVDMKPALDAQARKSIKAMNEEAAKLEDIKKQLESLQYVENPIEAAKMFSVADVMATEKAVIKKLADFDAMTPPYGWTGTKLEYKAKKLKFEAEEYLGTNKYGGQTKHKTWKLAQAAYFKELDKVNKLIEVEKLNNEIADVETYLLTHKSKKITNAIANAKTAIANGDLISAKTYLLDAKQTQNDNEASAKSKAKLAQAKKAEKQFWKDVPALKKTLASYAATIPDGALLMQEFEAAVLAKDYPRAVAAAARLNPSPFGPDAYSDARKNAAIWCKSARESHKYFDQECEDVWNAASAGERKAWVDYTAGSGHMNRPLRGYKGSWSNYVGIGNCPLDYENGEANIRNMYAMLERTSFTSDRWLQRGVEAGGLRGFLGVSSISDVTQALVGKEVVDMSFISCGSAKGTGFGGYILNIYCPKGSKGVYARPHSVYGDGENETILQAGTRFRITKVERSGGSIYIDLEVIGYDKHPQL